jgi:flagellin
MSLRINTNMSSVNALRHLHSADRAQSRSLERLASGLRINRGADDPSGLVISERLRQQVAALKQDSRNSQNAANLISTADTNLQKISDLLIEIQDSVQFALSTGSGSPDQIAAEQDSVDQAIAAIDRIAQTTRYGDRELLNGASSYKLGAGGLGSFAASTNVGFLGLQVRSMRFVDPTATSRTVTVEIGTDPLQANFTLGATTAAADSVIRVSGNLGSADVSIAAGADIDAAINAVADQTGVWVDAAAGDDVYSNGFGEDAYLSIEVLSGNLDGATLNAPGAVEFARGQNAEVRVNGALFEGKGLEFSINLPDMSFEFSLNPDDFDPVAGPDANAGDTADIIVENTGLMFQLRDQASVTDQLSIGIEGVTSSMLGIETYDDYAATANAGSAVTVGGFLNSLRTGGANDLTNNASNALNIVQEAAAKVSGLRGFLGAAVGFNVEPNIDAIDVAVENLSASLSNLRDLDFAEETAEFTRTQILFQSGIASLASARSIPQSVLQLLG